MSWKCVTFREATHLFFVHAPPTKASPHPVWGLRLPLHQSHFFTSSRPSLTMMNPFAVLASAARRSIRGIFVLVLVTLYAPPEEEPQEEPESRSELIHELQTALAAAGRTYLGGLAGEQMVALVQKVRGGDEFDGVEEMRYAVFGPDDGKLWE